MTAPGIKSILLPGRGSLLLLAFTVAALIHPLIYINTFSGDAEIHLVYAKNFLDGHPLQFNPGQPSSGQTSMGFMFIVILFMKLFGYGAGALSMKLIGLCSLYVIAIQTFRLARLAGLPGPWPMLAAITTLFMPGSVYNGMLGSENAYFGALVLTWMLVALRRGWLSPQNPPRLADDILLAVFMGAMFWIRPETIPFGGIAWAVRFAADLAANRRLNPRQIGRALLFGLVAVVLALAYVLLFQHWAGQLPFGAGYARLFEARNVNSVWVLGLAINVKVLERLAAYASVVLPALYALTLLAKRIADRDRRWLLIFLGTEFFVFMALYVLNGITALHFARYSIPVWPMGNITALFGLAKLSSGRAGRLAVTAAILAFLGMAAYEVHLRAGFERDTLVQAMQLPDRSEFYMARYGHPGMRPIVIATQEVQVRSQLDGRFVVRSLDGILDAVYLNYLCHGYNDHDGYFIDQKVDFLEAPFSNYNHDRSRWSLERFYALPVGQSVERPGVRYTKLAPDLVKVTRLVARSQDRAVQPCQLDSASPYW